MSLTSVLDYRLGDVIFQRLEKPHFARDHLNYKNTIAGTIMEQATYGKPWNTPYDIEMVDHIVLKECQQYNTTFVANNTAIHLRIGDVVCGNEGHERSKRPYPISGYKLFYRPFVFGTVFFTRTSATHCIAESNAYVVSVLNVTHGILIKNHTADYDFCAMLSAKTFVRGKGTFSDAISWIRRKRMLKTINLKKPQSGIRRPHLVLPAS